MPIKGTDKLRGLNKDDRITLTLLNIRPINAARYKLIEIILFSILLTITGRSCTSSGTARKSMEK